MFLVLGTPDPVALRVAELLAGGGMSVMTIARDAPSTSVQGVEVWEGDAASIDFGLSGVDYSELLRRTSEVVLADTGHVVARDVESSRIVRQAAEVVEFVRAGGAPRGVRYLSSLLVFGGHTGLVFEDELQVGQSFRDSYEESLAVAEKLVQSVRHSRAVSIVRVAPVSGDERRGELLAESALSEWAAELQNKKKDKSYVFSDVPVRFETVDRAANALFRATPSDFLRVFHLCDKEPLSDRQLVTWLAGRFGTTIHEATPGPRTWTNWVKPTAVGSRVMAGWGLRFDRKNAEASFLDLLDRDEYATLANLFPMAEAHDA